MADSLIHDKIIIPDVCTKFQILGQVVAEKSLTKKFTHTHTHTQTEKAITIYPLYTLYTGGINSAERNVFTATEHGVTPSAIVALLKRSYI